MNAEGFLKSAYPAELVDALICAYKEIENNYAIGKWKASELDAGHFVEAARRILDQTLFSSYTPIGKSLVNFQDAELKRYEGADGDESFRLLIPRVLKSIYNIRNKRGVGHLGTISPNEMDATLILYSVKWVLAELVRLASGAIADPVSAQQAVNKIVERRLDLIWKEGDIVRVLQTGLHAWKQVLILLYDQNLQTEDTIRQIIEYKNSSDFRKVLKSLHTKRLVEYQLGRPIVITPAGVVEAEKLILDAKVK